MEQYKDITEIKSKELLKMAEKEDIKTVKTFVKKLIEMGFDAKAEEHGNYTYPTLFINEGINSIMIYKNKGVWTSDMPNHSLKDSEKRNARFAQQCKIKDKHFDYRGVSFKVIEWKSKKYFQVNNEIRALEKKLTELKKIQYKYL